MNVKNLKKGFTLTELIIVIVIVGILAGVLIPTFINVVNKANRASDLSLVRNLNEALTLDSVEHGKHNNMTEALHAAQASGFDVSKISKKAKSNEILWDSENDVFCYLNGTNIEYYPNSVSEDKKIKEQIDYYKLWKIDDHVPATSDQLYSIYLYGLEDNKVKDNISLNGIGLDVGANEVNDGVTISYSDSHATSLANGRTVVIRTDWGNLVIDAQYDTVYHYNELDQLTVTKIASSSFHAYGFIAEIVSFVVGRFVAESTASFGQSLEQVEAALTASGNIEALSGLADTAFNQDAWDQNGVSKNHEGKFNENHVHQMTAHEAVAATCTLDGNIAYWQCDYCKNFYNNEDGAIENKINENSWVITKLGHNMTHHAAVTETCTTPGNTAYYSCDRCNKFFTDNSGNNEIENGTWLIASLGHDYHFDHFEWDVFAANAVYVCSHDSSHKDPHAASVTNAITTQATCTTPGVRTYTATYGSYNATTTEPITALGHAYGTPSYVWTSDNSSVTATRVCSRDSSHIDSETVNTTSNITQSQSCDNPELTTYTATFTKTAFTIQTRQNVQTKAALGHTWGTPTYVWNGNSSVTATRVCSNNSSHIDSETVNTTSSITQTRTCTNPELTNYTATFTNIAFSQQNKAVQTNAALGHNMTHHAAVAATYTNTGNSEYWSCSRCNKFFSDANGATEIANNSWVIPKLEKGYIDYNLTNNSSITAELNKYSSSNYTISIVFDKASGHTDITSTTPIYTYTLYDCSWNNNALTKTESTKNKAYIYTKVDSNVVTFYFLSDADLCLLDASDTSYDSNHKYFFKLFDGYNISNISFNNFIIDEHSNLTDLFRTSVTHSTVVNTATINLSSLINNYANHLTRMMEVAPFKDLYDLSSASTDLKQALFLYWLFNRDSYTDGANMNLALANWGNLTLPSGFNYTKAQYNTICNLIEGFEEKYNRLHKINYADTYYISFTVRSDVSDYRSYLAGKPVLVFSNENDGQATLTSNEYIKVEHQLSNSVFKITSITYYGSGLNATSQASSTNCEIIYNHAGVHLLWYYDSSYTGAGQKVQVIDRSNYNTSNSHSGYLPDSYYISANKSNPLITSLLIEDPKSWLIGYNSQNYLESTNISLQWYTSNGVLGGSSSSFPYYSKCIGVIQKPTNRTNDATSIYAVFEIKVGNYYVYNMVNSSYAVWKETNSRNLKYDIICSNSINNILIKTSFTSGLEEPDLTLSNTNSFYIVRKTNKASLNDIISAMWPNEEIVNNLFTSDPQSWLADYSSTQNYLDSTNISFEWYASDGVKGTAFTSNNPFPLYNKCIGVIGNPNDATENYAIFEITIGNYKVYNLVKSSDATWRKTTASGSKQYDIEYTSKDYILIKKSSYLVPTLNIDSQYYLVANGVLSIPEIITKIKDYNSTQWSNYVELKSEPITNSSTQNGSEHSVLVPDSDIDSVLSKTELLNYFPTATEENFLESYSGTLYYYTKTTNGDIQLNSLPVEDYVIYKNFVGMTTYNDTKYAVLELNIDNYFIYAMVVPTKKSGKKYIAKTVKPYDTEEIPSNFNDYDIVPSKIPENFGIAETDIPEKILLLTKDNNTENGITKFTISIKSSTLFVISLSKITADANGQINITINN